MAELNAPRRTGGRLAAGVLFAVLIGLASQYMLVLSPIVFLAPVLTALLYAYAGQMPTLLACVAQLGMAYAAFGPEMAVLEFLLLAVPLLLTLWMLRPGGPALSEALRRTIPIWLLCAALAAAAARYLTGVDLADYVAGLFRRELEAMPPAAADTFLSLFYGTEMPAALNLFTYTFGFIDPVERARSIASLAEALRNMLALNMTGMLLASAALTALMATALPLRRLVREGALESVRWTPLGAWRLPSSLAVVAALAYIAALVLFQVSPVSQALSVGVALQMLAILAFRVQALGSLERNLGAWGMRRGTRRAMAVLVLVLPPFSQLAVYYGMFSALFGPSGGALPRYLHKRRKGHDGDDDDDAPFGGE